MKRENMKQRARKRRVGDRKKVQKKEKETG